MKSGGHRNWIVLMLKDKYSQNSEKAKIKTELSTLMQYADNEIICTKFDRDKCISYYMFALDRPGHDDLNRILELKRDVFDQYSTPMRITQKELDEFIRGSEQYNETKSVAFGDIVKIMTGRYCNLNGIVLRRSGKEKIDVGIKLCLGTIVEQYLPKDLKVSGNIFKHIKVPT